MSIEYFVAYTGRRPGDVSASVGRCSITAQHPITNVERVEEIEAAISRKNGFEWCAVTNFQRFEEPTA